MVWACTFQLPETRLRDVSGRRPRRPGAAELVVQAGLHLVKARRDVDASARSGLGGEAARFEIDVIVLQPRAPAAVDREFDAGAGGPAEMDVMALAERRQSVDVIDGDLRAAQASPAVA